ncbi:hypothetical protein Fmac_011478 [Flemingia macrophylla]|uniref:Uncharacterized protein n=1 Tax=Flemingia macrophylla TaxID=520843 RepID=A0ABD1MMJ8_9FABA
MDFRSSIISSLKCIQSHHLPLSFFATLPPNKQQGRMSRRAAPWQRMSRRYCDKLDGEPLMDYDNVHFDREPSLEPHHQPHDFEEDVPRSLSDTGGRFSSIRQQLVS